jgi:hypothetical protein
LVASGAAAGWVVRVGYSRGPVRAVKVGAYRLVEDLGVWASVHPDTGYRWYAVYRRTVGGKSWTWDRIGIWKPGKGLRFLDATITDLQQFITVCGSVNPAWFKGISARVAERKAKVQTSATKRGREGSS